MIRWFCRYNLTLKIYLSGYVEIPASKNMTFDAALIIKFRADEVTSKIVLNSVKLNYPDNLEEIRIFQDKVIKTQQVVYLYLLDSLLEFVISSRLPLSKQLFLAF